MFENRKLMCQSGLNNFISKIIGDEAGKENKRRIWVEGTSLQGLDLQFYPADTEQTLKTVYKPFERELVAIIYLIMLI